MTTALPKRWWGIVPVSRVPQTGQARQALGGGWWDPSRQRGEGEAKGSPSLRWGLSQAGVVPLSLSWEPPSHRRGKGRGVSVERGVPRGLGRQGRCPGLSGLVLYQFNDSFVPGAPGPSASNSLGCIF